MQSVRSKAENNKAALQDRLSISAFDLDKTLLSVNSSFEFGKFLFFQKIFSFPKMVLLCFCYLGHVVGAINLYKLHEIMFSRLFKGRSRAFFEHWTSIFLDRHLQEFLYPPAYEAFQKALRDEHCTVILSSSPGFLVKSIAARLGADFSAATEYRLDSSLHYSALGKIVDGQEKATILLSLAKEKHVLTANTHAYSDSHLDLPFLCAAGHPVAVRPDRKLLKISIDNQWRRL